MDFQKQMMNPLFLGGAALLSGEGMGGAMRGMQVGNQFGQQRREQDEAEQRRQQFLSLLSSPEIMANKNINPQMLSAMEPDTGLKHLANEMDPATLLQRRQMEENLSLFPLKRKQLEAQIQNLTAPEQVKPAVINGQLVNRQTGEVLGDYRGGADGQATQYGLEPVFGRDERGDLVLMQLGKDGRAVRTAMPENITVDPVAAAQARAEGAARGTYMGGDLRKAQGKEQLGGYLGRLVENYMELDKAGGIVNPDRGEKENLSAWARSSNIGQAIGGAVGTQEQSLRQRINNVRPLLLQAIVQANNMSARALDSNKELEFYLQAATDPAQDVYANLVAIDVLDKTYGLGNVLQDQLPPEVYARVATQSQKARSERPIPMGEPPESGGDPLADARAAIARGAPREAVMQRLIQNGIDPGGL